MRRRLAFVLALGVLGWFGCNRGGVELAGSRSIPAPEVPTDARRWLNGKVRLSELKGQVVLVEAWHPS